jgi:nucleotide-binding universal stress UspA family protein
MDPAPRQWSTRFRKGAFDPMFDRILVPLDRTADSKVILSYLPYLLASSKSEVILAEAVPFVETLLEMPRQLSLPSNQADLSEAREDVARSVEDLRERGIRARGIVRLGSSLELLEQIAQEEKVSLIALSSHPPQGPWSFMRVGLPEKILENTRLPIFLVNLPRAGREAAPASAGVPWKPSGQKILVPMAGNPAAREAVEISIDLARRLRGTISIEALLGTDSFDWRTLLHVERGLELCALQRVPAEKRLARGNPALEILEPSRNGGADLITITARLVPPSPDSGPGKISRRVIQEANVPVLLVRPRATPKDPDGPRSGLAADPAEVRILRRSS